MNNNNFEQNTFFPDGDYSAAPFPAEDFVAIYYEKSAVRNTTSKIGVSLIFFFAVSILLPMVVVFALSILGQSALLSDPFITLALNILITTVGFLFGGIILIKKTKEKNLISFCPPKKGTVFPLLFLSLGFCYLANMIVSIIKGCLSPIIELKGGDLTLPDGLFGFLFSVLSVAIFPAFLEEFLFRGAILGSLIKFGKPFAIFTSAALFGLIHGNLVQIPFAFMVGLILGYAVVESGSIWVGILIHFVNNFISVCLEYLQKFIGESIINILYYSIVFFAIGLGFLGLYLLSLRNQHAFEFEKTNHVSSPLQRFKWTMSTPSIALCLVLVLGEILLIQFAG